MTPRLLPGSIDRRLVPKPRIRAASIGESSFAHGKPVWVRLRGTARDHTWTDDDSRLVGAVRNAIIQPPQPNIPAQPLLAKLRAQRLAPLTTALGPTGDGLGAARRLIVLPSRAMAGVPIEPLLEPSDPWTVSYAPSGTVLAYLRQRPHGDASGALLALGDPIFDRRDPRWRRCVIVRSLGVRALARNSPGNRGAGPVVPGWPQGLSAPHRLRGERAEACPDGSVRIAGPICVHPPGNSRPGRRWGPSAVGGDPHADQCSRSVDAATRWSARLRRPPLRARNPARLGPACKPGDPVGLRNRPGPRRRRRRLCRVHAGPLDVGARTICLSLWRVDDTATALLMQRFYANLLAPAPGWVARCPRPTRWPRRRRGCGQ